MFEEGNKGWLQVINMYVSKVIKKEALSRCMECSCSNDLGIADNCAVLKVIYNSTFSTATMATMSLHNFPVARDKSN